MIMLITTIRMLIMIIKMLIKTVDKQLGREEEASEKLITFVKDREGHDFRYAVMLPK